MKYLTDKTYVTKTNNWYAPTKEIEENYKSVVNAVLMDTTSSAGDWSGFIVQKIGKHKLIAIGFSQYNNYPHDGFCLMTSEHPFYRVNDSTKERNYMENIKNCWLQFDN